MNEIEIVTQINKVLVKRGKMPIGSDLNILLRDHGFRSMDFSEVALRIEDEAGNELNFDANSMRAIETFRDVVDFFQNSLRG
jgi:acyl carrier protein